MKRFFRLFLLLTFCASLAGSCAHAQTRPGSLSSQAILNDNQPDIDLGPFLYVTPDPDHILSFKDILERHNNGYRGDGICGNILTLGATMVPHWVVFSVTNQSWTDRWVLSFGQHMQGRVGLIKEIFLYDAHTGQKYLDNITSAANPYIGQRGQGATNVALTIPRGGTGQFFLYVVPEAGMATTLAPRLITEQNFNDHISSPFELSRLLNIFFAAMIGFFLASIFVEKSWIDLLFVVYYGLQMAAFNITNVTLYTTMPYAGEMTGWLFSGSIVMALIIAKFYLEIGPLQYLQNRIFAGLVILILGSAAAAILITPPSMMHTILLYLPSLLGLIYLVLLSLAQALSGGRSALFALSWLIVLSGFCTSFLAASNVLIPTAPLIAGYWWSLIGQGALLAMAITGKHWNAAHARYIDADAAREEEENVGQLRQVKEAAENQRLKRMIDHERAAMNELRTREIEQNAQMREARDAADEANRAKSAFLAVVSHEIRTPMSGVLGMVRLLLETSLSRQQEEYAQTIQDSSDAMLALLNDILDFEKIESDKMSLEHVDFDLHRLVQGVVTLMNGHAAAKGLFLKIDMDESVPRYVIGDSIRLRQVLLNLTGNSIKFTAQGGVTLHIKTPSDTAGEKLMHRILFSVEDTGIGISLEAQKNLFNPFSQADTSITRKFGGTGLGLAISQRLIEAMGGKIRIDSTQGSGSSFYFTLIMEEGRADAVSGRLPAAPVSAQTSEKSLHILIVEDNVINQKLLKEFVDRMGHSCSLAGSGEEALTLLAVGNFDMLLMDIELPGMSGMGTTKAIRSLADRTKAAVPVIALSGNVRDEDRRAGYAANMNGYLSKPVDPKRLKGMIDKVIKGTLDNPVALQAVAEDFVQVNRIPDNGKPPIEAIQTVIEVTEADSNLLPGFRKINDGDEEIISSISSNKQTVPLRELALMLEEQGVEPMPQKAPVKKSTVQSAAIAPSTFPVSTSSPSTPPIADRDVFDSAMLIGLRDGLDVKSFEEMMVGLFDKTDEILAAITDAQATSNEKALGAHAHDLKGMAANFGIVELSRMATALENALKAQDTHSMSSIVNDLPAANIRAKDALRAWLAEKA